MPDNIVPATGADLVVETQGVATLNQLTGGTKRSYPVRLVWGPFGTFNPPTLDGGMPVQFDIATAARVGATNEAAPSSDTATAGLNGRLQRVAQRLTSLIGQLPASLGPQPAASSLSMTFASDQEPMEISGGVDLQVGGSAAATGSGAANANTLRVVAATDQTVPVVGRTTREYAIASGVRTAFGATSTAAIALPTLGASREVRFAASARCWVKWGTSGVAAAAAEGASLPIEANAPEVLAIPAGVTHFRVIRDVADGHLQMTPVA